MSAGRPDWERDGGDWPNRAHSRFVEVGALRWHVQVMGEGPTLLLLPGTGASTHSFRQLLPLLAARFQVIAPDLPGQGFSHAPLDFIPSLTELAAALVGLLSALGVAPAFGVGHSAGAAVLVRMALDGTLLPRALVGLAPALVPFRGAATTLFAPAARLLARSRVAPRLIALQARGHRNVERMVRSTGSVIDAQGVALYARLAQRPAHVAAVLRMMAHWDLEPLDAQLPGLQVPLLIIAGENDRAVPLAQLRKVALRLKHGSLKILPGTGHLLHEEQPAAVAQLIVEAAFPTGAPP